MRRILLFSLLVFIISCNRNDEDLLITQKQGNHLISKTQIEKILLSKNFNEKFSKSRRTGKVFDKTISTIQTIISKGIPIFYAVNYQEGGYIIISADNRLNPILALSEENTFDYNSAKSQNGIGMWLSLQTEAIEYIRNENPAQSEEVENAWDDIASSAPPDDTSGSITTYVDALTTTKWGQGQTYNDYTPIGSCGLHTLTGCVATAMAQIIKYNEYSGINNYNWSWMPDDFGTSETSRLMHDAGLSVNMNYGCEESGALTSNIQSGFAHFGYVNAKKTSNLIANWITNDLALNKPVILTGGGHAWVCDGSYTHSEWDADGGWTIQLFHMNWGWNGNQNDYYSLSSLNPYGLDLRDKLTVFYNLYHLPN
ncbi:hypothetical protein Q73A0000_06650 [Kaistella flava (ex Peng et al. 2021)]|uniref:Spi protease inhibitor domain-containing protein n=1 Tax=Kaistella flava (ex Peng et al. 2021) TaxID=2038776 RepID=A0A7M2Y8T8_9FLAO|nr:C10 family peptidase [Kaistella flava (ex Peng et al. 2021)]QOW10065.1 hypothetical protein Q73A0000_06650 [Kaistella flava (ex Peng et al. 2021)]